MGNAVERKGKTYGFLTVIERAGSNKAGAALWQCVCKCGNETVVLGGKLANGTTKSCTRGTYGCAARREARRIEKEVAEQ